MKDDDARVGEEELAGAGPVFLLCSALTAALLLAIVSVLGWQAVGRDKPPGSAETTAPDARTPAARRPPPGPSTTIYVVNSKAEAERLQLAFEEWDRSIRESGLEVEPLIRVVVAESPEDVLKRRVFDFSFLRAAESGENFRVIDLR